MEQQFHSASAQEGQRKAPDTFMGVCLGGKEREGGTLTAGAAGWAGRALCLPATWSGGFGELTQPSAPSNSKSDPWHSWLLLQPRTWDALKHPRTHFFPWCVVYSRKLGLWAREWQDWTPSLFHPSLYEHNKQQRNLLLVKTLTQDLCSLLPHFSVAVWKLLVGRNKINTQKWFKQWKTFNDLI